jgi:hypothetical protein
MINILSTSIEMISISIFLIIVLVPAISVFRTGKFISIVKVSFNLFNSNNISNIHFLPYFNSLIETNFVLPF